MTNEQIEGCGSLEDIHAYRRPLISTNYFPMYIISLRLALNATQWSALYGQ